MTKLTTPRDPSHFCQSSALSGPGRRSLLITAILLRTSILQAQDFPTRAMRIIVPFAAGGSSDILARIVAQHIEAATGAPGVVDNRAGGGGVIGVMAVKMAAPDGYTAMLCGTTTHSANPSLLRNLPYDPQRDFATVAVVPSNGSYLLVRKEAPWHSVADLVAAAKAAPNRLSSGYFNSSSQVPAAMLNALAGIEVEQVPYRVIGNAFTDLLGGRIDFVFVDTTAGDSYVSGGLLRPLAVTRPIRWDRFPDLPTLAETWPDFTLTGFLGIAVPAGTPQPILEKLNALVNEAVLAEPARSRLMDIGLTPTRMDLDACALMISEERQKWAQFIQLAGIQPQ